MALAAGTTPKLTDFFPNASSDGTNVTIPIAEIVGLTPAEADPTNGNASEFVHKFLQTVGSTILAADEADRPVNMTYTAGDLDPQANGSVRLDYLFNFELDVDLTSANTKGES